MMGWQWHLLDHMQIICTSLQTDNHASTSSLTFLQAGCSSWRPTNSAKALKSRFLVSKCTHSWCKVVPRSVSYLAPRRLSSVCWRRERWTSHRGLHQARSVSHTRWASSPQQHRCNSPKPGEVLREGQGVIPQSAPTWSQTKFLLRIIGHLQWKLCCLTRNLFSKLNFHF